LWRGVATFFARYVVIFFPLDEISSGPFSLLFFLDIFFGRNQEEDIEIFGLEEKEAACWGNPGA
jgi:hypothetical protein